MPRPRFQRAAEEKREALLDAATFEFAARGYDDASINRILLAAGFSKGSFYYYFDDKADLAMAVLDRWAERYDDMWDDVPSASTPAEFWAIGKSLIERGTARLREEPTVTVDAMMRLGTAIAKDPAVRERLANSAVERMMAKAAGIWKHGQDIGAVRRDLPVSHLLILVQEMKLALMRLTLPSDRAATVDEIEAFSAIHFDLVRRLCEAR
jgi:AcrR family transcriptional regulator